MQVYISSDFSSAIKNSSKEDIQSFEKSINIFKNMNKTTILNLEQVFKLPNKKNLAVYAYNSHDAVYILFTFNKKNELVVIDVVELVNGSEIRSLVYPNII